MARGGPDGDPPRDDARAESLTLREAAQAWLVGAREGSIRNRSGDRYKPSVLRGYEIALRLRLLPELGGRRVSEIRRADVQDFADRLLARGDDASTIRNTLMPLRAIFRRAVARGDVAVNPTTGLELPAVRGRRDRIVSPEQAAKLLDALPERDRALWATALYGGLRRGELQALRWEDVDLAKGVITVERAWDVREGHDRAEVARRPPHGADRRWCCATTSSSTSSAPAAAGTSSRAPNGKPFDAVDDRRALEERVAPRRPRADHAARGAAHVREPDDRRRRQREGARDVHGPRLGDDHVRPLRPPDARQRERSRRAARRVPRARGHAGAARAARRPTS